MEPNYYVEQRPWGQFKILYETLTFKVKELLIKPGQRFSYQTHHKRGEHWLIVQGEAVVTRDDEEMYLTVGESVDLPVGTKHRLGNRGSVNLICIEVQTGTYFGEDDIVRLSDDYKRV